MQKFVKNGVSTYFVSPPGFDDMREINHRSDDIVPFADQLGLIGHLLSLSFYLFVLRPDRFVPFNIFGGFVGGLVGLLIPTETVLFVRGDVYRGKAITGGLRARLIKRSIICVEWISFRLVDHIVFISQHNKEMMIQRTRLDELETETTVLYNNTFTDRVTEQLDASEKSLDGSPVIGFAGEFPSDSGKGVSDLIDAVALLDDCYPNLHLYLLGRGDGKKSLQQQARHRGVEDRVHFPGWVEDPIRYMQAFDLYILPSYHEGLGNSLLEALAAETPIAGSDIGGIPEVVYDRKYLFEPRKPADIAAVIDSVFNSDEAYRCAMKNCRERRTAFDFDWAGAGRRIVKAGSSPVEPSRIPPVPIPHQLGAIAAGS